MANQTFIDENGNLRILHGSTGGGDGATSLSDLSDVSDLSEASEGQALVYNAESQTWKPGTVSGGEPGDSSLPDPAAASVKGVSIGAVNKRSGGDFDTRVLLDFDEFPFINNAAGSLSPVEVINGGSVEIFDNGKFGKSAYFPGFLPDGSHDPNSYLKVYYPAGNFNSVDCKIEFFVQIDTGNITNAVIFHSSPEQPENWNILQVCLNGENYILTQTAHQYETYYLHNLTGYIHVALVRHENFWYSYINGTRSINKSPAVTLTSEPYLILGNKTYGDRMVPFKGWIDEFRIQFGDMSAFAGETIPVPDAPCTRSEAAYIFPTPVGDTAEVPNDALIQLAFNGKPRTVTLAQLRTLLQ